MSEQIPHDGIVIRNARLAVKAELKKKQALKQPVAMFDAKTGEVYIKNGDGSRTAMGQAMTRGRYSERRR